MSNAAAVVLLLVAPLCGLCAVMRRWLDELRVEYRELDVTSDPQARRLVRRLANGEVAVPILVLEDGTALIEPRREAVLRAFGRDS